MKLYASKRKTANTLRQAARRIETYGLAKGRFYDPGTGRFCVLGSIYLLGSIYRLGSYRYDECDYIRYCDSASLAMRQFIGSDIPSWNDKPIRTKEQVVKTMRQCASALEHGWPDKPWNYEVPQ